MNFSDNVLIGKITLAAGISALLQVVLLILMFTVSRDPFGRISDYFYVLTPLLVLPLIFTMPKILGEQNVGISQIVKILGIVGILISSMAQIILLLKIIVLKQSIWGNVVGYGLIGLPILIIALLSRGNPEVTASFNWFGIILGTAMAIGIPAGFFFLDELYAIQNGTLALSATSPLIYPVVLAGILTQIGLPIWLIWISRLLLSG